MAKAGLLADDRGKRTYRISHDANGAVRNTFSSPDSNGQGVLRTQQIGSRSSHPSHTHCRRATDASDPPLGHAAVWEQLEARDRVVAAVVARANAEAEAIAPGRTRHLAESAGSCSAQSVASHRPSSRAPASPRQGSRAPRARRAVTAQPVAPSPCRGRRPPNARSDLPRADPTLGPSARTPAGSYAFRSVEELGCARMSVAP